MAEMSMLGAIQDALALEMGRDERVVLLGEDVGVLGGVFRATDGLLDRFGSDRVVDTPLAEGGIIGTAVGMAVAGLVPVAELQFLGFGMQAYHQIVGQLARVRWRSNGRQNAQVTIRAPLGGFVRAPEFHGESLEAHFTHAPGLKVVMPSNPYDAKGMLLASLRDPDPVLFCEPLRGYRAFLGEVPEDDYEVALGAATIARPGDDVCLIAWSAAVQQCIVAAEKLEAEGLSVSVLDLRTLVPLDVEAVASAVAATGRAVVVQEASLTGGFASEVISTIQEEVFYELEAPIARVAAWDVPFPPVGYEEWFLPSVDRIVDVARATAEA
jgi:pyruvate dehydrogenase E1 component beta subunit